MVLGKRALDLARLALPEEPLFSIVYVVVLMVIYHMLALLSVQHSTLYLPKIPEVCDPGGRHARACHVHFPLSGLHGMAFDVWKLKMYLNKRLMRTALKSHAAQLRPVQATASCVARR